MWFSDIFIFVKNIILVEVNKIINRNIIKVTKYTLLKVILLKNNEFKNRRELIIAIITPIMVSRRFHHLHSQAVTSVALTAEPWGWNLHNILFVLAEGILNTKDR